MVYGTAMLEDICYSGVTLDRAADLRRDEKWLVETLRRDTTRIIPMWREHNLILMDEESEAAPQPVTFTGPHALGLLQIAEHVTFLGIDRANGEAAYYAADLSAKEEPELSPIMGRAQFLNIRQAGGLMTRPDAALMTYARGMATWHKTHQFCGTCGSPTEMKTGGHQRTCSNTECGREHFPRTDPAVIMLVERPGPEGGACLLSHKSIWPQGMWSILAGFVEPGESLEDAVIREVKEEVGIDVEDVRYMGSQPWPFPASLMLGFVARAKNVDIKIDPNELEDAGWFTRDQIARLDEKGLRTPNKDSIARRIVDHWIEDV